MANPEPSSLAAALGRIPTGIYVVTSRRGDTPIGFVGSFVAPVGFVPPAVCLAIANDRPHLADIRAAGRFALSVLDKESRPLMGTFLKAPAPGTSPFDKLVTTRTSSGLLVLSGALAWIECELRSEASSGDHVVVIGEVVDGAILRAGDPHMHVRKNGLSY